jgi:hypothetical protein
MLFGVHGTCLARLFTWSVHACWYAADTWKLKSSKACMHGAEKSTKKSYRSICTKMATDKCSSFLLRKQEGGGKRLHLHWFRRGFPYTAGARSLLVSRTHGSRATHFPAPAARSVLFHGPWTMSKARRLAPGRLGPGHTWGASPVNSIFHRLAVHGPDHPP